jgi:hypothetical protein
MADPSEYLYVPDFERKIIADEIQRRAARRAEITGTVEMTATKPALPPDYEARVSALDAAVKWAHDVGRTDDVLGIAAEFLAFLLNRPVDAR